MVLILDCDALVRDFDGQVGNRQVDCRKRDGLYGSATRPGSMRHTGICTLIIKPGNRRKDLHMCCEGATTRFE